MTLHHTIQARCRSPCKRLAQGRTRRFPATGIGSATRTTALFLWLAKLWHHSYYSNNVFKKRIKNINDSDEEELDYHTVNNELIQEVSQNEIDNYITVINTMPKKNTKNKNGTYNINNKIYEKLMCS